MASEQTSEPTPRGVSRWVATARSVPLAAWSGTALVASATWSAAPTLVAICIAISIVSAVPLLVARRRDPLLVAIVGVSASWLIWALIVGSLPSPTAPRNVLRWAETEGRVHVALFAGAIGAAIPDRRAAAQLARWSLRIVTWSTVMSLPFYVARVTPGSFRIQTDGHLLTALTSSHHVVGFLAATAALVVLAVPGLVGARERTFVVVVAALAVALSGSRSALVGAAVGGLVVAIIVWGRRCLPTVAAIALVGAMALVLVPRFRETVEVVARPEFVSEAVDAFGVATTDHARSLSDSPVEANMLIRFALWGATGDVIGRSPFVGIGVHRINDVALGYTEPVPLVSIATSGRRVHSHTQPHNMYLHLLAEVGIFGAALFAAPYVLACVRLRRVRSNRHLVAVAGGVLAMALTIGVVSAALLTTGLGIPANLVFFAAAAIAAQPTSPVLASDDEPPTDERQSKGRQRRGNA